jgi:hypothetical protein
MTDYCMYDLGSVSDRGHHVQIGCRFYPASYPMDTNGVLSPKSEQSESEINNSSRSRAEYKNM